MTVLFSKTKENVNLFTSGTYVGPSKVRGAGPGNQGSSKCSGFVLTQDILTLQSCFCPGLEKSWIPEHYKEISSDQD